MARGRYLEKTENVTDAGGLVLGAAKGRDVLIIQNKGADDVELFLDGLGTFGNGLLLAAGTKEAFADTELPPSNAVYARCDTGQTATLLIWYL